MTKLSAKLSVEFNPQGGVGYNLQNAGGQVIADRSDIQKIQTLGSSIAKERKDAQKDNMSKELKYTLAAMVQRGSEIERPINRFPDNFVAVYRSVNSQVQTIAHNLNAIEAVEVQGSTANTTIKAYFMEVGKRTRIAIGQFLFHRATIIEGSTPFKLNHFLRIAAVPVFFFNRLSKAKINFQTSGFNLASLVFPSDPTKGFFLTFRELRDDNIRNDLGGLLEAADLLVEMALDDTIIRSMINVSDNICLDNFDTEKSFASKIASTPFFIPPITGSVENKSILNFLAKNGSRGVNWSSGTVLSPQDNLKFLGTIAKRMHYALLGRPQFKALLLGEMFPGFEFAITDEDQKDIYVQLKAWAEVPGRNLEWFTISSKKARYQDRDMKDLVVRVFADIVALDKRHVIPVRLKAVMGSDRRVPCGLGHRTTEDDNLTAIKTLAATYKGARFNTDPVLGQRIQDSRVLNPTRNAVNGKVNLRAGVAERSMLTSKAMSAIAVIRGRNLPTLATRMSSWFRQFLTVEIQDAVADLFLARFEAFLDAPIALDRQDRLAFLEPDAFDSDDENEEPPPPPVEEEADGDDHNADDE
jgi:hypothetical protein